MAELVNLSQRLFMQEEPLSVTDLTVAICTYQRPELLRTTLMSLASCEPIKASWDLLLVDNGCSDEINQICRLFESQLPIRYVQELQLGISHARNCAVRQAAAPIVLFSDDDVIFEAAWLSRMWTAIIDHPQYAFWGGRVVADWPIPTPSWYDPQRCPMLGDAVVRYDRGQEPRDWDAAEDPPFYTANLALRVEAVAMAGFFDPILGYHGRVPFGGEDSLMVKSISDAGGKGWYAADAVVHHPVPSHRTSRCYARQFAWRQGCVSVLMARRDAGRIPLWLYRLSLIQTLTSIGTWFLGAVCMNQSIAFAGQVMTIFNLSKCWHCVCPMATKR